MGDFNAKKAALDGIRQMARQSLAERVKKKAEELRPKAVVPEEATGAFPPGEAAPLSDDELELLLKG